MSWDEVTKASAELPLSEVLDVIDDTIADGGVAALWLWDHQRRALVEVRTGRSVERDRIEETVLDRAAAHRFVRVQGDELGLFTIDASSELSPTHIDRLARLVGAAVRVGEATSDTVAVRRRTRPMSLPAEMQWRILPPGQFTVGGYEVSAAVEPAYDTGGDVYDYALIGDRLFLAVLDARGHGLRAATTATVAASAMRRARRQGADLITVADEMAAGIGATGDDHEFVSAVLMTIDLVTGRGRWLSAGHLPPLLVDDRAVALDVQPTLPLGMVVHGATSEPVVGTFELEPDRSLVLYSDGIIENAAEDDGMAVGEDRFHRALLDRIAAAGAGDHVARAVVEELLAITGPTLRDDATLMIVSRSDNESSGDEGSGNEGSGNEGSGNEG